MSTGSTACGLEAGEVFLLQLLVSSGARTAPAGEGSGFLVRRLGDATAAPLSLPLDVMWGAHHDPSTATAFAGASGSALSPWSCSDGPVPVLAPILPPFHTQDTLLPSTSVWSFRHPSVLSRGSFVGL